MSHLRFWIHRFLQRHLDVFFGPQTLLTRFEQYRLFLSTSFQMLLNCFRSGEGTKDIHLPRGIIWRYYSLYEFRCLSYELFRKEIYELPCRSDAPLVIDCGSNDGLSVAWFKLRYPGCRIMAFEPAREAYELCCHNLKRNGWEDVTLHQVALGARDEIGHMERMGGPTRSVTGALVPSADERAREGLEAVTVRRLSTFIEEPVDFLKLDVEGGEWDILRDLRDSGTSSLLRAMMIEIHSGYRPEESVSELLGMVEAMGFRYRIEGVSLLPRSNQVENLLMVYAFRPDDCSPSLFVAV